MGMGNKKKGTSEYDVSCHFSKLQRYIYIYIICFSPGFFKLETSLFLLAFSISVTISEFFIHRENNLSFLFYHKTFYDILFFVRGNCNEHKCFGCADTRLFGANHGPLTGLKRIL